MKIKTTKQALAVALGKLAGVPDTRSSLPAYANVLIEAWPDGGLALSAMNVTTAITARMTAESVDDPGCNAVDAKRMASAVKALPDGNVSIVVDGAVMVIKAGRTRYKLPAVPGADYPTIPTADGAKWNTVPSETLRTVIGRVRHAACFDETRAHLCGIRLDLERGDLMARATDGHRYAGASMACDGADFGATVPYRAIQALLATVDGSESVEITSAGRLHVRAGDVSMSTAVTGEAFPPTARVIPETFNALPLSRVALSDAVRRVVPVANETKSGGVMFALDEGAITLSAEDATAGAAQDVVDSTWSGKPLAVGVRGQYVLDVLGAVPDDTIEMSFTAELDPVVAKSSAGGCEFTAVVMPMRIGVGS